MEVSQTPRIYMVETEEKEAPESKLYPPHILRLPPQMKRIGTRRTHLLSSLQNCGNYGNNAFNNLEKTKKEENDGSNEDKVKEGQTPMPKTKNKLNPPVPKVFVPRTTRDLPMLPEMTPATVETVGESNIGWTQRQHPMPKVVKVNRIIGALDHVVDPWTGQLEDHMGSTKIKLVNTLLVALRKESKCGNYFENFLTKCKNKLALNCLYLWHNIEKFLQIFYTQPVNMFRICRYAKFIYSKFIANGSPFTVRAGPKVMLLIWQNLDAPVGDMFDEAVEHILIILSKFWHRLLLEESWIYRKINH
ncbi:uncharacterized protein LOC106869932 [Octopus bimaculoides]|uniref:RGS domain-containing protein n=1 Tax=Octopus bimaculoides TaxID=37653 RepID=A0A0L8HLE6_OCTBM|nr:uncharacterized protein LOC106869932 [Octopus bimaculoides]|eukprot:XP_014771355.1 PREDICTED: uncharacterized protein LOC106869932 [Octopus bimaculoides]